LDPRRIPARLQGAGFVSVVLATTIFAGSGSPCQDPKGASCAKTNAFPTDDPRSICHVCCESSSPRSDAWTEVAQTDVAAGRFTVVVSQRRPYSGTSSFSAVEASRTGEYFAFDDRTSNPGVSYHLFTRGRPDDGNIQVYLRIPGDGPVSAAPLNCTIARN
jgi:hypothetical protein